MDKRVIHIDTVNKVKIETIDEMENSIFTDIYHRSYDMLVKTVQDNDEYIKYKTVQDNDKYIKYKAVQDNDEYIKYKEDRIPETISNTISFLGNRGRGKTSAMLSFLFNLDKLQNKYAKKAGGFNAEFHRNNYIFLPYIDAAMLAKKEYVLDVVLAKNVGSLY